MMRRFFNVVDAFAEEFGKEIIFAFVLGIGTVGLTLYGFLQ